MAQRVELASSLNNLGGVAVAQAEHDRMIELYEECLRLDRELGDKWGIALALGNLGIVATHRGEYQQATELHGGSVRLMNELGHMSGIANVLASLGIVAGRQRAYDRASQLLGAAEATWERIKGAPEPDDRERMDGVAKDARAQLGAGAYETARASGRAMTVAQAVEYALGSGTSSAGSVRT